MRIESIPADWIGAYGDLIYTIADADPNQTLEVEILGGTQGTTVMGKKLLKGESRYTVNIAPYLRPIFDPQPRWTATNDRTATTGWLTKGGIRVDGTTSTLRNFTAGLREKTYGKILTEATMPFKIAPGECIELACSGARHVINHDYAKMLLNGNYTVSGWERVSFSFVERPTGAVRLCWINPFGGFDYYTFGPAETKKIQTEKHRVTSTAGNEIGETKAGIIQTIRSQWETAETLGWLAQILAAPRVWLCESNTFRRVEVLTDSVTIDKKTPGKLLIAIRNTDESKNQRL